MRDLSTLPNLKVALVQTTLAWHDREANYAHFEVLLEQVGEVDLVILPEMFTTGFSMQSESLCEPENGPTYKWLKAQAKKHNAVITGSVIIQAADGSHRNRLLWARPDGEILHYDKRHLFRMADEHQHYQAGDARVIFEWRGWRILPLVCYDLRFPVWSRNHNDYDLALYVANWPVSRRKVWDILLQARALEKDRRPDCMARVRGGGLSLLSITNFLIAGKRVLQVGKAHQLAPKENRSVIAVFTYC